MRKTFTPKFLFPQGPKEILLTGEELFALGDIGAVELVKGKLIRMTLTGYRHGFIAGKFGMILGAFVYQHKLGRVLVGEVGLYTHRHPDTVRGMDVARLFLMNVYLKQTQRVIWM